MDAHVPVRKRTGVANGGQLGLIANLEDRDAAVFADKVIMEDTDPTTPVGDVVIERSLASRALIPAGANA